jgi:IS30 family transposase
MGRYGRLTRLERAGIERGLDTGCSARAIARGLGRSPSTVTGEVMANRTQARGPARGTAVDVLPERHCQRLDIWPHVCNGCRYRRHHCGYRWGCEYAAARADALAHGRLSSARRGVDRPEAEFEAMMATIRSDVARGLSPAQICHARSQRFRVDPSTVYRWIAAGYGGMSNVDLRRKVGYRPRRRAAPSVPTSHGPQRSYAAFASLPGDRRGAACEMDTVLGRSRDTRCILTLYLRPCRFQLCLLLPEKTSSAVAAALDDLETGLGRHGFEKLFGLILTDNGTEFADTGSLERSSTSGRRTQVYYCDVRQSQQKAGCERNHAELRKILPKGRGIAFDGLTARDMSVLMSHLNSQPRPSLMGNTPLSTLQDMAGPTGAELLDLYGVREVPFDELVMAPAAIDRDRAERGLPPLIG